MSVTQSTAWIDATTPIPGARIVTTFVETLTALLVTMTLLAATAIVREWPPVTERILDTHYPKKDVAPGVTLPTVPLSRLGHLLW